MFLLNYVLDINLIKRLIILVINKMGKRKYEKIDKILNVNNRNVTYNKRTKGLVKKSIELSVLCDQEVFVYVYDKNKNKVIHFHSDPDFDIKEIFNRSLDREFLSNKDYVSVGGEKQDWDIITDKTEEVPEDKIKNTLKR